MTPEQVELQIREACANFENFVLSQMVTDWIRSAPAPYHLLNNLLSAWKARMEHVYDEQAKLKFAQSGIISTDREFFDGVMIEAARRIRESVSAALNPDHEREQRLASEARQ